MIEILFWKEQIIDKLRLGSLKIFVTNVSISQCYQIRGHAEVTAGGDKLIRLIGKHVKHLRLDDDTLSKLWKLVKNVDIEVVKLPVVENTTTGPSRSGPASNYPLNYPKLSTFQLKDLEGSLENKQRFLEFIKLVEPVYKMLISSLNQDYYEQHRRSYPLSMMAHDFIQIANHFNVIILKNGGRSYGLDWSEHTKRFMKRSVEY